MNKIIVVIVFVILLLSGCGSPSPTQATAPNTVPPASTTPAPTPIVYVGVYLINGQSPTIGKTYVEYIDGQQINVAPPQNVYYVTLPSGSHTIEFKYLATPQLTVSQIFNASGSPYTITCP